MNTHQYLSAFRRGWYVVLIVTLAGVVAGWGLTHIATPVYTATSSLYFSLSTGVGGDANDINQGNTYTQNQMLSFAQLAQSTVVLQPVINELGLNETVAELSKAVTVTTPQSTVILDLSVADPDAKQSAVLTNAVAQSLASTVEELAPKSTNGKSTVLVRVVQPAVTPIGPSAPNERLNILAGLLLGLIVGVLILVLRELLETRVRSAEIAADVTGAPILGSIQQEKRRTSGELVMSRDPLSNASEAYRQLRTNLEYVAIGSSTLCLVITSSVQGEGKSTIAANLALSLSESGQRVLLIDADLRRPAIASYTGLEGQVGLTTVLVRHASFDDVVQHWGNTGLNVLPSGAIPPNPSEMLSSRAMTELLADLRQRYDMILIDTAPLAAVADAAILAPIVDGALVVIDRTKVHRSQLAQTVESLGKSGATVLGLVLNRVAPPKNHAAYYYQPDTPKSGLFSRTRPGKPGPSGSDATATGTHEAGSGHSTHAPTPADSRHAPTRGHHGEEHVHSPADDHSDVPQARDAEDSKPVTVPVSSNPSTDDDTGPDDDSGHNLAGASETLIDPADIEIDADEQLVPLGSIESEPLEPALTEPEQGQIRRPSTFRSLQQRALRNGANSS